MLRAAGFAEVATNTWSDRMIDAVVLWGNEAQVEEQLWELMSLGATKVLVPLVIEVSIVLYDWIGPCASWAAWHRLSPRHKAAPALETPLLSLAPLVKRLRLQRCPSCSR